MNCTLWVFFPNISCIVYDLGALKVARKIQVMGSLQVDDLFTTDLWV